MKKITIIWSWKCSIKVQNSTRNYFLHVWANKTLVEFASMMSFHSLKLSSKLIVITFIEIWLLRKKYPEIFKISETHQTMSFLNAFPLILRLSAQQWASERSYKVYLIMIKRRILMMMWKPKTSTLTKNMMKN